MAASNWRPSGVVARGEQAHWTTTTRVRSPVLTADRLEKAKRLPGGDRAGAGGQVRIDRAKAEGRSRDKAGNPPPSKALNRANGVAGSDRALAVTGGGREGISDLPMTTFAANRPRRAVAARERMHHRPRRRQVTLGSRAAGRSRRRVGNRAGASSKAKVSGSSRGAMASSRAKVSDSSPGAMASSHAPSRRSGTGDQPGDRAVTMRPQTGYSLAPASSGIARIAPEVAPGSTPPRFQLSRLVPTSRRLGRSATTGYE